MYEQKETETPTLLALRSLLDPKKEPDSTTLRRLQDALLEYIYLTPKRTKRIWWKIDPEKGCWLWQAGIKKGDNRSGGGYGQIYKDQKTKMVGAHQFMYEATFGPITKGLDLDHLCRVRHCVNPFHLEPVCRGMNSMRGNGSKLSGESVLEIVEKFAAGVSRVALAKEYEVEFSTIFRILSGERWNWLTGIRKAA